MTVATNKANGVESFSLVLFALPPALLFAVVKEEEAADVPGGLDPQHSGVERASACLGRNSFPGSVLQRREPSGAEKRE